MCRKVIQKVLLLIICIFLALNVNCKDRIKVGLVLSGGGAKGLAHVGVLKALEENNIPVDYITGTSIGALIGGLYAGGYTVDSIISIVTGDEFRNWTSGTIDEKYNFYYKKSEPNASWFSLRFTVDSVWEPKLPTNLISPVQMDYAGMVHFSGVNVASKKDFDSLFIPFRCVAADIEKKKQVVFKQGDIYDAIRASLTYPFLFRPIIINGSLLFDGGIYNNFPLDVMMEEFNPDYVIGSAVGMVVSPLKVDDIRSQLENLIVFPTDYDIPDTLGLTIRPDVPEISITDFGKAKELINMGYEATIKEIERIKESVNKKITKDERQSKRDAFVEKIPPLLFEDVTVNGVNEIQEQYIRNVLLISEKPIESHLVKPLYFNLLAEDHIGLIRPKAIFNENTGYYILDLDITVDRSFVLKFGGNLSSSPVNQAYIDVRYLLLRNRAYTFGFNAYVGRFYSSVQLSARMNSPDPFPYFLETAFTSSHYDYFRSTTTFFEDRTPSYLLQNQTFYRISAGLPAGSNGKFVGGVVTGINYDDYFQTNIFSRADTSDRSSFNYFSPYFFYERYTLNDKQYPTKGNQFSVTARFVRGGEDHRPGSTAMLERVSKEDHFWLQMRVSYENYFKNYERFSFGYYSELLLSNTPFFSNYTSTLLTAPAFQHVPSSKVFFIPNFRAHNFAVAGLNSIFSITENIEFRLGTYIFQPYREILRDSDDYTAYYGEPFEKRYFLGDAAVVVKTAIGPLSLTMNYFHDHDDQFVFSLNFGYLIFHQLPLR